MIRHYRLTTSDGEAWRAALPAGVRVTGCLELARILERYTGHRAELFVYESGEGRIAYPYLLRPVGDLPCAAGLGEGRWDTVTPDYTGPLATGVVGPEDAARFAEAFAGSCRERGIVAEFAHLNPWHASLACLEAGGVTNDREVVYVDLTWGMDRILERSLTSDARRALKQAGNAGVRTRFATSRQDVLDFHRLHDLTMQRRGAQARYFHPAEYFLSFLETMPDHSFLALAELDGRVVAGGIYVHDDTDVYWHLSAADMEHQRARPVNAFHLHAIRWAVEAGKQRLLCGGGYAEGDGVFRFKASFSPLRAPFRVYRRIHDAEIHARLVDSWSRRHHVPPRDAAYFPAYRAPPPAEPLDADPALLPSTPTRPVLSGGTGCDAL